MTKRQTAIAIIALIVIVACIVVAQVWPPTRGYGLVSGRPAGFRNAAYLTAAVAAVLAVILSLSPWGRSKD